jgi:hypothetical protein
MPFLSDFRAMLLAGIAALCLLVAGVQTVRLNGLLWFDGALDKVEELRFENNEMREAIREAHEATLKAQRLIDDLIRQGKVNQGKADDKAREIEMAPLPGNCRTPDEIMRAEI